MTDAVSRPRPVGVRWATLVVVLLVAAGSAAVLAGESGMDSSGAAAPPSSRPLVLIAPTVLVAALAVVTTVRQDRVASAAGLAVACLASCAPLWASTRWVTPPWAGWFVCCQPFVVPALAAVPAGWSGASVRSRIRGATWLFSLGAVVALLLAYDPFRDVACLFPCLSAGAPFASRISASTVVAVVALLVAAASALAARETVKARRTAPVPVVGATATALAIIGAAAGLVTVSRTDSGARAALQSAPAVASLLVGLAVIASGWRADRVRTRLARLVSAVEDPARPLAATGRTDLDLQFALPGGRGWVDVDGRPVPADPPGSLVALDDDRGPAVRLVASRPGHLLDAVTHLGPWERTALVSAREAATTRAHRASVIESQRRIVELTDRERRRIEGDLHDGAQQRLVSVKLHLRLAAGADPEAASALGRAEADVQAALTALRELVHGQVPRLLETEGVTTALRDLEQSAPVRVVLEGLQEDPGAESAVAIYALVSAAIRRVPPDAGDVAVRISRDDAFVTTVVAPGADVTAWPELTAVADRFGALGGSLSVHWDGSSATITGRLP